MLDTSQRLWICLIEADGCQLGSKYYRRRDELALRVRGDKELGPLMRRAGEEGTSVIFQEGAVITTSESLARQMAWLAQECFDELPEEELEGRHPTVSIGRISLTENLIMTKEDSQVMDRIGRVLGKRGRKPAAEWWVVSCTECAQAHSVEHWSPVNCPNCAGFLIHSRRGQVRTYADPGGDIFDVWMRTRFSGPHWEPVAIDPGGQQPPTVGDMMSDREAESVNLLATSPVLDKIRTMPRDTAISFLDAMFIHRTYRDLERRLQNRIEVATRFFARGGLPTAVSLTEPKLPDLVDAADIMGNEETVTWMMYQAQPA